jgi:hypothetical protein
MHLLIPFAAPLSDTGRRAAASLVLPRLQALLGRLTEVARDEGDEWTLTPPHERALARALGLQGSAGLLPWAARQARLDGVDTGDLAWGLLTPGHWHLGTEQVSFLDPDQLLLDEAESRAFYGAVQDLFISEGFVMHWGAALRWYIAHESLASLPSASLDRVVGRAVDYWLGSTGEAQRIRRLQSEVQMLLYTHPLNDERTARGLLPVNSFWLSGCGPAQPETDAPPQVDERLRRPTLDEDWAAWVKAWQALDEGPVAELLTLAQRGQTVQLTLCGERTASSWALAPQGLLHRLQSRWRRPALQPLLEGL